MKEKIQMIRKNKIWGISPYGEKSGVGKFPPYSRNLI